MGAEVGDARMIGAHGAGSKRRTWRRMRVSKAHMAQDTSKQGAHGLRAGGAMHKVGGGCERLTGQRPRKAHMGCDAGQCCGQDLDAWWSRSGQPRCETTSKQARQPGKVLRMVSQGSDRQAALGAHGQAGGQSGEVRLWCS